MRRAGEVHLLVQAARNVGALAQQDAGGEGGVWLRQMPVNDAAQVQPQAAHACLPAAKRRWLLRVYARKRHHRLHAAALQVGGVAGRERRRRPFRCAHQRHVVPDVQGRVRPCPDHHPAVNRLPAARRFHRRRADGDLLAALPLDRSRRDDPAHRLRHLDVKGEVGRGRRWRVVQPPRGATRARQQTQPADEPPRPPPQPHRQDDSHDPAQKKRTGNDVSLSRASHAGQE